ncbi:MAG: transporter substrate-binding domain-containing protein [Proteobacteria bacterium]|nr:transporter substrate-binding domain-containing protein [Pseudomonadota bacterium]
MRLSALACAAAALLVATVRADAADGLDPLLRAGTLKVCTIEAPPFAMKDGAGRWIGHEIDIGERLAADLGVRAGFVAKTADDIAPALASGTCDIAAAALAIDGARLRRLWFSRPYADTEVNIVVPRKPGTTTTVSDLDKADVTLAVVAGSDAADAARSALPHAKLRAFPDLHQARQALDGGNVAGLVQATPIPTLLLAEARERYALVDGLPLRRSAVAFALKKGAADLLNFVDGWIEVHQRDGYFERIDDYWYGGIEWTQRLPAGTPALP